MSLAKHLAIFSHERTSNLALTIPLLLFLDFLKHHVASTGCPCCAFTLPNDLFLPRDDILLQRPDDREESDVIDPVLALEQLGAAGCSIFDTHSHAHLSRQGETVLTNASPYTVVDDNTFDQGTCVWILSCGVAPEDWAQCLEYASQSLNRRAALGVHPWYLDQLLVADKLNTKWLDDLEDLIRQHPYCFVGEIGLCKKAKFVRTYQGGKIEALALQQTVLVQQLNLAARYQRPVSVHCVDQHAVLLQLFKDMGQQQDHLPPVMALHSFSGTAHHVRLLLDWEASLSRNPEDGPLLYFGFSHSINYLGATGSEKSRRQNVLAIQSIPKDRLLAESDVDRPEHVAAATAGAIAYLAWALQQDAKSNSVDCKHVVTLASVAQQTWQNATRFFRCLT